MIKITNVRVSKSCYWNFHEEELSCNDSVYKLSLKQKTLLKLLIEAKEAPVSVYKIFNVIFEDYHKEFNSKSVRALVSNLRKKLPDIEIINHYGSYSLKYYRPDIVSFQEYLPFILDQAKNGIIITDPSKEDNPIIYANAAFTDMFGYEVDEIVGENCRFLQGEDKEQEVISQMREAIAKEESITVVVRNYHKNGNRVDNEVTISPIFDIKSGKIKFFLGIQKDVTNS